MRLLTLAVLLFSAGASAQTLPFRLPQFVEPPASNGADGFLYPNGILYNPTLGCLAGAVVGQWPCLATDADVTAAQSTSVQQAGTNAAAIYLPRSEANTTTATLNGRIDMVQAMAAAKRACATAVLTGVSVSLAGISSETSISIPGVPVGTSCDSGSASFMPLGARPDAIVTTAGTARLRFVSNGGLLSAVIAIPNGTYRVCCDL